SLIARAAERLTPRDLGVATRELARWLAAGLSPKAAGDLVTRLRDLLLDRPLSPMLAAAVQMAHRHGWDQRAVTALTGSLVEAFDRPAFRSTVGELVDDLLTRYRERMGVYPRFWIGVASLLGLIDRERPRSEVRVWIVERLERARWALAADEDLRQQLDRWAKARVLEIVERHHQRLAEFIENGVLALGPEGAVRLIEEHAGDDLQYIRVNGTVVGGLAGGLLYAVHLLLRLI